MDYNTLFEERNEDCIKGWTPLKKELRAFLEEEQKASEAGHSLGEEEEEEEHENIENLIGADKGKKSKALILAERTRQKECEDDDKLLNHKLRQLAIIETNEICEEVNESKTKKLFDEEDDEERNQLGKGNVEKWLQIMLENAKGSDGEEENQSAETVNGLNQTNPEKESKHLRLKPLVNNRRSFNEKREESCESSSRGFRSTPSSPSVIMGMRRGEANLDSMASTSSKFIKSCTRTLKRTVSK